MYVGCLPLVTTASSIRFLPGLACSCLSKPRAVDVAPRCLLTMLALILLMFERSGRLLLAVVT